MAKESIKLALSVLWAEKDNLSEEDLKKLVELTDAGKNVRSVVTDTLETTEKRELSPEQQGELFSTLEARFSEKPEHYEQHEGVDFAKVKKALEASPDLMYSLAQMENTGGVPDIIAVESDAFIFGDCSAESPARRNLNYDKSAEMAKEFGADMMPEDVYHTMQKSGKFDMNTWSWLKTPADIRESGLALHGNRDGYVYVRRSYARSHGVDGGWRGVLRVPKA